MASCTTIASDSSGIIIASGSEDTKCKIWDLRMKQNQNIFTFKEHSGVINSLQLSPDSRWIASGSADGSLKIWDISTGKVMGEFKIPGQQVTCVEYNPQSLALANGSTDRTVKYYDLEDFSTVSITNPDTSAITNLTFDEQNSEYLFSGSSEAIRLWNIETNKLLDCIAIIPKTISDLKVAAAERFLQMSAISNNTISVWYAPLELLNFDENIDMLPSSDSQKSSQMQIDYQQP